MVSAPRTSSFLLTVLALSLGNADGIEQVCWILARELIDAALDVPLRGRIGLLYRP
jgi:hypothetical protein